MKSLILIFTALSLFTGVALGLVPRCLSLPAKTIRRG